MSVLNKTDDTSILAGQVKEKDFIVTRGQWMGVLAYREDSFAPARTQDIVRFNKDVSRNVNNHIVSPSRLYNNTSIN